MSEYLTKFLWQSSGRGAVRDYAVFITENDAGDPSGAAEQLNTYLGQCGLLRQWAASVGGLSDTAEGLEVLEGLLAGRAAGRPPAPRLRIETGLFIGTVLIRNLSASWRLLPTGYPVIHLAENSDLDVMAIARERLAAGTPDLTTVLPYAESLRR
ncbi:hypothetical protein ASG92_18380 [Arthrobacter sp. Soil736]|uniref:DUF6278 family protein n=1 Tax=Arthrobacter sp. Soil736 TaxID=1736395 RepID=UPI000701E06C|nr:DUF6278 family protein [Arthrobacter sp. Soil736]KRE64961.1 hypothetical protein ASG92_18380 [Arthrobacter sp. Soil736]